MSDVCHETESQVQLLIDSAPSHLPRRLVAASAVMVVMGVAGLIVGFASGIENSGWVALLVSTSLVLGWAVAGVLLSAIFQLTGRGWGSAYRRLAEGAVVLMPVALLALVILLIGAGSYLPWLHVEHLKGGKQLWLQRGFWDARVILLTLATYGVALFFLYYSLRKDFCNALIQKSFSSRLAAWLSRDIADPDREAERCEHRLSRLAPVVAIVYAVAFTFLGIDLIMALEPEWYSTLFGAWYFIGHLFAGLAIVALISLYLKDRLPLGQRFSELGQRDLATLLFAFVLLNMDFFWSQYLTIWYGNLPEETSYLLSRTGPDAGPWLGISYVTLLAFFGIPFVALLFRRVKHGRLLLGAVALIVVAGVFLSRFMEIAPPLLEASTGHISSGAITLTLVCSVLTLMGFLGTGLYLYGWFFVRVPMMPVPFAVAHSGEEVKQ